MIITVFTGFIKKSIPLILIAASIIISYFFLQKKEVITLVAFMILIPIFTIFRFDGRIPLGFAILLLCIVGVLTFMKYSADQFVIMSYWLLVVGTSCLLVEFFREKRYKTVE